MTYLAKLKVWRGDDTGGELRDFAVDVNEGEVILDVIHRLQAEQAPDLAVRWNCKAGKCGSCSAEINGRPRLMCMTRMSTFDEYETISITPLRAFPVIRDLVTDVTLVGRFTIDRPPAQAAPTQPDGEAQPRKDAGAGDAADLALREEEYAITGAVPLGGDLWALTARIRYGETDVTIPVPIAVKWAGDTPVLTLDRITLPGLGTFSSRVVLDGDRYAGTWQHDDVGGHMFGRIERRAISTGPASPRPADR
jgi:ferredoxin